MSNGLIKKKKLGQALLKKRGSNFLDNGTTLVGANTVKWTYLYPCSGLSESYPKLYTNFDLYEIKIHKHLQSQTVYVHNEQFQTTYMYFK